ncbi:hypothetical protein D3C71_1634580 [compost metagenome]
MGAARVGVGKKIAPIARNPSRALRPIRLEIKRCLMGLRVVRFLSFLDSLAPHPSYDRVCARGNGRVGARRNDRTGMRRNDRIDTRPHDRVATWRNERGGMRPNDRVDKRLNDRVGTRRNDRAGTLPM